MKIKPRKYEFDKGAKTLVERVISELPENFVVGTGEAKAHFSQANGGTIKIYPVPFNVSFISGVNIPGKDPIVLSETVGTVSFEYNRTRFLVIYK
mgnify:CR=1 FL=1